MNKPHKIKQNGGTLLAGTGRGGVHRDRKNPTGKQLRKASKRDWRE